MGNDKRIKECKLNLCQMIPNGHYSSKGHFMMTPVYSEDEYRNYMILVMRIKNTIAELREDCDENRISKDEFRLRLGKTWLPLTKSFIKEFGKEMVPFDVRFAINDVETEGLGLSATEWPAKVKWTRKKTDG